MRSKILPIAGDASFRKFYRFILNEKSRIIVFSKKEKYKNLIAYSSINKFLKKNKILTPKLYTHDFSKGVIIIEDFGNLSFHKILLKAKNKFSVYKKLVDLLLKIQNIKIKSKIKNTNKGSHIIHKYSKKYLFEESNLFFDWYLPLFLSKKKISKIKLNSNKILSTLYKKINFPNTCFVHRDFHSQNLMKVGKKIGIIDSQDALIGNPAYDLVSLIDDVRIKTSTKLKNKVYSYYLKKVNQNYKIDSQKFLEDFEILSVQRNLKIIGIFSRLFVRDKKQQYLKHIPYIWKLLDLRMKSEIFYNLKKILKKNISKKNKKKISFK